MRYNELFEAPTYNDKELPQIKGSVGGLRSIDTLNEEWIELETVDSDGSIISVFLKKTLSIAIVGKWVMRDDGKKALDTLVSLTFKSDLKVSYVSDMKPAGNLLQVEIVEAGSDDDKRVGYGYQLYKAVMDAGYTLISDNVQYRGGRRLWEKIVKRSAVDNHNVFIIRDGEYLTDDNGDRIKYDGSNIRDSEIWGPQGSMKHHFTLLLATNT
jgi:hypothetical protein